MPPRTIGYRFLAPQHYKICKASLAAELITYDSLTKMTQSHDWTQQLSSQRRGRATHLNTLNAHCWVCSSPQASQALLNWPVQSDTSLTNFADCTSRYTQASHTFKLCTKIFNIKFQRIKKKKSKTKNFKNLIISNFSKIQNHTYFKKEEFSS